MLPEPSEIPRLTVALKNLQCRLIEILHPFVYLSGSCKLALIERNAFRLVTHVERIHSHFMLSKSCELNCTLLHVYPNLR